MELSSSPKDLWKNRLILLWWLSSLSVISRKTGRAGAESQIQSPSLPFHLMRALPLSDKPLRLSFPECGVGWQVEKIINVK